MAALFPSANNELNFLCGSPSRLRCTKPDEALDTWYVASMAAVAATTNATSMNSLCRAWNLSYTINDHCLTISRDMIIRNWNPLLSLWSTFPRVNSRWDDQNTSISHLIGSFYSINREVRCIHHMRLPVKLMRTFRRGVHASQAPSHHPFLRACASTWFPSRAFSFQQQQQQQQR